MRLRRTGAAFTLMEVLVAIAASLLVALALAALFTTVGQTVTGGRRVSQFNTYATLIERQMREDFRNVTRDGFLVIRHEYANAGPIPPAGFVENEPWRVGLSAETPEVRRRFRRTDEILFFAVGDYSGSREPLFPGYEARAGEARIYYGHGVRADLLSPVLSAPQREALRVPAYDSGIVGTTPQIDPEIAFGRLGQEDRPNQLAGGWSLLRHQTLLTGQPATLMDPPTEEAAVYGIDVFDPVLRDRPRQVALQPAAPSVFRQHNWALSDPQNNPDEYTPDRYLRAGTRGEIRSDFMMFQSGLIDIATTDLAQVRTFVEGMIDTGGNTIPPDDIQTFDDFVDNPPRLRTPQWSISGNAQQIEDLHRWMRQALPADSNGDDFGQGFMDDFAGVRVRYEPTPPGFRQLRRDFTGTGSNVAFELADRINDQFMLASSVFVPRCTEFKVEWTFGLTNDDGELVWYGGSDLLDNNNNGIADEAFIVPYEPADPDQEQAYVSRITGRVIAQEDANSGDRHPIAPELIYGRPDGTTEDLWSLNAHFGYTDPTSVQGGTQRPLPWAWPKLIRVTVTLADPNDTEIEETFQFVFDTPPPPRP